MKRVHLVLAALFVFQLVVIGLFASPWSERQVAARGEALVPGLEATTPRRLEIETGEGERVVLERAGEGWVLPDLDGYPVDTKRVDELLDALKKVHVKRPVVSSARYHKRLEVAGDKFQKRLRVFAEGDEPIADLYFGTSPQYQVQHVRRAGEDAVYEARGLASWQLRTRADGWIDKHLVDVPIERVTRVELTNPEGTLVLERHDDDWRLAGRNRLADRDKAEALVRQLASLWIARPVGRLDEQAQGFSEPQARWVLTVAPETSGSDASDGGDGKATPAAPERIEVLVGREDGDERLVTRAGFGFAAAAAKSSLEKALTATANSLAS